MASPFDTVKGINMTKKVWKIGVRVTDNWVNYKKGDNNEELQMVIMDSKGDKIQFMVLNDEMDIWSTIIIETATYVIQNFKVVHNDLQFKLCDHPFKLIFTSDTVIYPMCLPHIPPAQFDFKPFADIINGNFRPDRLVDIIGAFHEIVSTQPNSDQENVSVTFAMKDLGENMIHCTLWEDHAKKFLNFKNNKNDVGPFVIIITHARIKERQGTNPASVSHSSQGSRLLIHNSLDIPKELLITNFDDPIDAIVRSTYPNLRSQYQKEQYLRSRAILASRNEVVDQINDYVVNLIPGEGRDYFSADSIDNVESLFDAIPIEFLWTLKTSGIPNHKITLKIGTPIMLLCTLSEYNGLRD